MNETSVSVLMVIERYSPLVGGAEQQCLRLSKALQTEGIKVHVATYRHDCAWPRHEVLDGVPVTRIPLVFKHIPYIPGSSHFGLAWYLIRATRHFDVVHIHGLGMSTIVVAFICWLTRKPTLIKFTNSGERNDLRIWRSKRREYVYRLMRWSLKRMTRVVAICQAVYVELIEDGIPASRIVSIPNGIDYQLFAPPDVDQRCQRRTALGLPQDAIIVLRVGTFMKKKGVTTLLSAWEEIAAQYPNVILLSLGGTDIPRAIRDQARRSGDNVHFVLNVDDVLPYYQAADVFVLPSLTEGLSNALLEAQACGLACVVTDVGGNTDVVEHGKNGLIVPPNNAQDLAKALTVVIENKELRESLGIQARTASLRYSMTEVARRYATLYCQLIGG